MKKHFLSIIVIKMVILSAGFAFAQDKNEARQYVQRVFNDNYTIAGNNAPMKTKLSINNCNMVFKYMVAGNPEKQSVNMRYLDVNKITSGGSITIGTIGDERRVSVSTMPNRYWAIDLPYDSKKNKDPKKIIESLKTVISSCQ